MIDDKNNNKLLPSPYIIHASVQDTTGPRRSRPKLPRLIPVGWLAASWSRGTFNYNTEYKWKMSCPLHGTCVYAWLS